MAGLHIHHVMIPNAQRHGFQIAGVFNKFHGAAERAGAKVGLHGFRTQPKKDFFSVSDEGLLRFGHCLLYTSDTADEL